MKLLFESYLPVGSGNVCAEWQGIDWLCHGIKANPSMVATYRL